MPLSKAVKQTIEIPEGIQVDIDKRNYKFKGPKGAYMYSVGFACVIVVTP